MGVSRRIGSLFGLPANRAWNRMRNRTRICTRVQYADLGTGGYETVQLWSAAGQGFWRREKKRDSQRVPLRYCSGDSLR
jgi:hypothetical protein